MAKRKLDMSVKNIVYAAGIGKKKIQNYVFLKKGVEESVVMMSNPIG